MWLLKLNTVNNTAPHSYQPYIKCPIVTYGLRPLYWTLDISIRTGSSMGQHSSSMEFQGYQRLPLPCLQYTQAGGLLDRLPREMGEALWGDNLPSTIWEYAIHFNDRTDISSGRRDPWLSTVKWRLDSHLWETGHKRESMCVCVPMHRHARSYECGCVFRKAERFCIKWPPRSYRAEECVPLHICGLFLMFSRKGGILASSVLKLHLLDNILTKFFHISWGETYLQRNPEVIFLNSNTISLMFQFQRLF